MHSEDVAQVSQKVKQLVTLSQKIIGISHKVYNKTVDKPQQRFICQRTGNEKTMDIVEMFLSRDDNSRASVEKNQTITRLKKKKQKRGSSLTQC